MKRDFLRLVRRHGTEVILCDKGNIHKGKAFVQFVREKDERFLPTPLGNREQGRLICFCDPELSLETASIEAQLIWHNKKYHIATAQPISVGDTDLFVWAVLLPEDEEERT